MKENKIKIAQEGAEECFELANKIAPTVQCCSTTFNLSNFSEKIFSRCSGGVEM